MNFPETNFPACQTSKTERREVFYEYGSHGYVDVTGIYGQNNEVFCQKVPEGFQKKDFLCARRPTLPLSSTPEYVYTTYTNDHMKEVLKVHEEALSFRTCIKRFNLKHKTLSEKVKKEIEAYYLSSSGTSKLTNDILQKLTQQYQRFRNWPDIPKTSSEYAGGCVSYLLGSRTADTNSDVRLVSATGNDLSQLRITDITINQQDLTLHKTKHEVIGNMPLREVTAKCVSDTDYLAARGLDTCRLYSNRQDSSTFTPVGLAHFTAQQGHPTSVHLSDYIPGDCLVSTTTGAVYLWSPDNRPEQVIGSRSTRFMCSLPWRRAEFGAHPREVIASDPTVVQLFDIRRSPGQQGVDLFALPSPLVMLGERIHLSTQSTASEFHHFVACNYSLFLIDQRFPSTPVLSWKHMLVNPPQYLEGVNFPTKDHSILLIASQSPPEVCCYTYKCSSGMAAQALGAPWRVSRIDDVFYHGAVCGGTPEIVLTDRFNTSLTGITAVPVDEGFFAVQMDSYGEVFYQGYTFSSKGHDKTCSVESDSKPWDDITIKKGRKWISRYLKKKEKKKDNDSKNLLTPKEKVGITDMSLAKKPHIRCPICHPDIERMDNDTDTDQCPVCCQSLATGHQLIQSGMRVVGYGPDDHKHSYSTRYSIGNFEIPCAQNRRTEKEERFPETNALSKILKALWEEESPDLTALLKEKDEEVNKKKEENKEKRQKKSNKLEDEDQQLIRNLQIAVDAGNQSLPLGDTSNDNMESSINNREPGSDGEDSDTSFHRLFGIDISTLREEEHQLENDIARSTGVTTDEGQENISVRSQDFLIHSKKRKKRLSSAVLFSDDPGEEVVGQPTDHHEAVSTDESYMLMQSADIMDDRDSEFFSQDIAQSFSMFSESILTNVTPTPRDPKIPSFTSKMKSHTTVINSPNKDWKLSKKRSKISYQGF
ncbi:uncharacterized protein LOC132544481 [Ylistrum balloti]|uniref:uncharacterized protein LOC132544481 n=1 Tax=Ylistrum balloti TaxID=509963 RepID=UPI002905CBAA|nr:uncharacterized protein LOC132544481 [Ylistrum balloti]